MDAHGYETVLLDAQVTSLDTLKTVEGILKEDPAMIGLSVMSVYAHAAYAVAAEFRARAPHTVILLPKRPPCVIVSKGGARGF